uniref:Ig-like domain-containing protein n=1 Tax=Bubo bubo TaxID=30461 RepID=A0A8C0I8A2_BUBBB
YTAKESGNVSVQCPYSAPEYGAVSKAWCKEGALEDCSVLVTTNSKPPQYHRTFQQGKLTIQDDTKQGVVTITMGKLQAQDSGVYLCALYEHDHIFRMVEVTLNISEGDSQQAPVCLSTESLSTSLLPEDLCHRAYLLALRALPSALIWGGYTQSRAPAALLAPPSHILIFTLLCLLPASLDDTGYKLGSLSGLGVTQGVDLYPW